MRDDVGNILSEIRQLKSKQVRSGKGPSVFYVGVMVGLFTDKHMKRMGQAIYTYGLLLSKVTGWDKRCSLGAVLKGAPLKLERLAKESGINARTIRRHVKALEEHGYIITLRSQVLYRQLQTRRQAQIKVR
jgi:biotin operon repressor